MALPAVVVSMITLTSSMAGVLGIIKRRCGACRAIAHLVSKSNELVGRIRKLLKTLEDNAEGRTDARAISMALNLRREEFDSVLRKLEKMKQRTKRTNLIHRTKKFIMAQSWAKNMEAIRDDLVHLRNGIETIVTVWNSPLFADPAMGNNATNDLTNKKEAEDMNGKGTVGCEDQMRQNLLELLLLPTCEQNDPSCNLDTLSVTPVWNKIESGEEQHAKNDLNGNRIVNYKNRRRWSLPHLLLFRLTESNSVVFPLCKTLAARYIRYRSRRLQL